MIRIASLKRSSRNPTYIRKSICSFLAYLFSSYMLRLQGQMNFCASTKFIDFGAFYHSVPCSDIFWNLIDHGFLRGLFRRSAFSCGCSSCGQCIGCITGRLITQKNGGRFLPPFGLIRQLFVIRIRIRFSFGIEAVPSVFDLLWLGESSA